MGAGILSLVERQLALGPRVPGSPPHDKLSRLLEEEVSRRATEVHVQQFSVRFEGCSATCRNVLGVFRARQREARRPPVLLGTHYDTRPRADRERDPRRRRLPIPGANDGGSGTAVLLSLLGWLASAPLDRDVTVAFLDAEDLGGIDGNPFSLGADYLAAHPLAGAGQGEVVILDMVGGRNMRLDVDAHALRHPPSLRLTKELHARGLTLNLPPFTAGKPVRVKWIVSDQWPFLRRGIPSALLIDLDYPEWHTQDDLPAAMAEESLAATARVLRSWLSPLEGSNPRSSAGSAGP